MSVLAYESLQDNFATARRMADALLRAVSITRITEALPKMTKTVGAVAQSVRGQAIEELLEQLRERRWEEADFLVLYQP